MGLIRLIGLMCEGYKNEKWVSSQKLTSLITKIQVYMFFSLYKRCICFGGKQNGMSSVSDAKLLIMDAYAEIFSVKNC